LGIGKGGRENLGRVNLRSLDGGELRVGQGNLLLDNGGLDGLVLDWLLDSLVLDGLNGLVLDGGLDGLLDWLMDELSFNGLVFNSLLDSLLRNVLSVSLLINLRDILGLVFNGVIVGDSLLSGDNFLTGYVLIIVNNSLNGDTFNTFNGLIFNI